MSVATAMPTSPRSVLPGEGTSRSEHKAKRRVLVDARSATDGSQLAAALPAAVDIPEAAREWVNVYGVTTVRNLFSKEWKDREVGLSAVLTAVKTNKYPGAADDQTIWRVTTTILEVGLREKVVPLFFLSLDVLSKIAAAYGKKLPSTTVQEEMDEIIPVLMHRVADRNQRIHDATVNGILTLMHHLPGSGIARMHPYIFAEPKQTSKVGSSDHNFNLQRRLELLTALHGNLRTMNGFDLMEVLKFCKRGLESPDDKVRSAAMSAIAELNKVNMITHSADLDVDRMIGPLKPQLMEMLQKRMSDDYKEPERPRTSATSSGGAPSGRPKTGDTSKGRSTTPTRPGTSLSKSGSLSATQKLDWLVDNLNEFDAMTMDDYDSDDDSGRPRTAVKMTNSSAASPMKASTSSPKKPAAKPALKVEKKPSPPQSLHTSNMDSIDEQLMTYILDEEAKDRGTKGAKQPFQRVKSIHAQ